MEVLRLVVVELMLYFHLRGRVKVKLVDLIACQLIKKVYGNLGTLLNIWEVQQVLSVQIL